MTLDELALDWDRDSTSEWVTSAEERGLVARSDDGDWRITKEGRVYLRRIASDSITVGIPTRRR